MNGESEPFVVYILGCLIGIGICRWCAFEGLTKAPLCCRAQVADAGHCITGKSFLRGCSGLWGRLPIAPIHHLQYWDVYSKFFADPNAATRMCKVIASPRPPYIQSEVPTGKSASASTTFFSRPAEATNGLSFVAEILSCGWRLFCCIGGVVLAF